MKIITVTNQKGGVGKTAVALHLAFAGQDRDRRVLFVDLDTQGNASATLSRDPKVSFRSGGAAVLFDGGESEGGEIVPQETPTGIDLLHGHQRLDAVDASQTLEQAGGPIARRLRQLPHDLVVVDTPPAIGLRHLAPMLWADLCITPLEANAFSVAGLAQTLQTLGVARRLNPDLQHRTVINRHVRRSKEQARYLAELAHRVELTAPYLAQRVAVADALEQGVPVWRFRRATRDTRDQWHDLCEGVLHALDA